MQTLHVVIVVVISLIFAAPFAALDKGYAQLSLNSASGCPTGQVPVLGPDGRQSIDPATGLPICSPLDTFNKIFGY